MTGALRSSLSQRATNEKHPEEETFFTTRLSEQNVNPINEL